MTVVQIIEQIRRFFGALPVSYDLSDECIIIRNGSTARELVRLADIGAWHVGALDSHAVSICLREGDRGIVVCDPRGRLRELLERVADDRRDEV